jgi:two-component system phosphate regulon response regulator PhoB
MARINAVLRRFISDSEGLINDELIVSSGLSVNFKRVEVLVDEKPIVLTATEFKILSFLIRSPGSVFTRSQIVKAVHGENYAVTDRTIDFQMVGLRKKLLNYGDKIETIRGIGYRFKDS